MSTQSTEAYKDIQPRSHTLRSRILTLLSQGSLSFQQVSKLLNMRPQTASARLSELNDEGLIFQDEFGLYNLTPSSDIESTKLMREEQRFRKWKTLGDRNGWFLRKWGDAMSKSYEHNTE